MKWWALGQFGLRLTEDEADAVAIAVNKVEAAAAL